MANKILGITVDIEGKTSGLTNSLKQANSAISKTTSALRDVDKALQLDPTNVELLAQKESLLNKQIEQTNEKLEILGQVANDANEALARGDITEEQYAQLTAEIVKTESALSGLESEAEGSSDALEETGESAEASGESMEDFGESAKIAGELAVASLEAVVASAIAVGTAVASAFVGIGSALVDSTVSTSQLADELLTLSVQTGLSTDTLQELNYASELLDVDTQTVTSSMTKLLRTMDSARDGSSSAQKAFEDLGISIYDTNGELKDNEEVFWEAIDALGQISNETERDASAMALFGKNSKELNTLIDAGSESFYQLAEEAKNVGYVMDTETLEAFGAFDDNVQRLDNTAQAVSQTFGAVLLPLMTEMSDDAVSLMGDFSGALAETGGDIESIGAIIEQFAPQAVALVQKYVPQILKVVQSGISALVPALTAAVPDILSTVGTLIETVASSISEDAEPIISAVSTLLTSAIDSLISVLPVAIPLAVELIMTLVNAIVEYAPLLVDGALTIIDTLLSSLLSPESVKNIITSATLIITTLLNGLTQSLPNLVTVALQAIMTIVDTLLSSGSLGQILSSALTLVVTLAEGVLQYTPVLISYLPELITALVKFLCEDARPDIIQAGFEMITAIVGNMPEIISAIIEALVELVKDMGEYITGEGADNLLNYFNSAFEGIVNGAKSWGGDLVDNFIKGMTDNASKLAKQAEDLAGTVSSYLHFSEPEKGPLSDFNESGADMIQNFIDSMESEKYDLERAMNDTASIIGSGMSAEVAVQPFSSSVSDSGLASLEQALTSRGTEGGTWVFPIYLGGDLIDTVVVDALDRYNYQTGGH